MNDIINFFTHHGLDELPRSSEFRQQLVSIANNIFVVKPEQFISQMRKGIPATYMDTLWRNITSDDLNCMIEGQRPTPENVAATLKTSSDDLRPGESAVFYYVGQFVRSLNSEELANFLQFVTGSVDFPSSSITVAFFSTSSSGRHVVAHTCSSTLEVSTAYSSYQQFRREFLGILRDEHTYEFTLA